MVPDPFTNRWNRSSVNWTCASRTKHCTDTSDVDMHLLQLAPLTVGAVGFVGHCKARYVFFTLLVRMSRSLPRALAWVVTCDSVAWLSVRSEDTAQRLVCAMFSSAYFVSRRHFYVAVDAVQRIE